MQIERDTSGTLVLAERERRESMQNSLAIVGSCRTVWQLMAIAAVADK